MVWQVVVGGGVLGGVLGYALDVSEDKKDFQHTKTGAIAGAAIGAVAALFGPYEAVGGAALAGALLLHKGKPYDDAEARQRALTGLLLGMILVRGYQVFGGPVPALPGLKR